MYTKLHFKRKILNPKFLVEKQKEIRKKNLKIVTLNGCFDILHSGHLSIIFEAKEMGDILIVALNSDESIKKYKGNLRPIIPLKERVNLMCAIECVDYVTWFDELDPRDFLEKVRPDVHVNGYDYGKDCIESDILEKCGAKLHIANFVEGLSTTDIINKINSQKV